VRSEATSNKNLGSPLRLEKTEGRFRIFGQEDAPNITPRSEESDGPLRSIRPEELLSDATAAILPPYHISHPQHITSITPNSKAFLYEAYTNSKTTMDQNQIISIGSQDLVQRQQELVQHLNQVRSDNAHLQDTVASSNAANTERFQAIFEQIGSQSHAQREHAEKLERTFSVLEGAMSSQNAQAVEQTNLLQALVEQLKNAASVPTSNPGPVVPPRSAVSSTDQSIFTPAQTIPFPDGNFIRSNGSNEAGVITGGAGDSNETRDLNGRAGGPAEGSNGNSPPIDPSIIKPQLPLIQPRQYKGERKDNACEQWCMDMHSFLRRFEILTGKFLVDEQAVEYISQYFADAALTWWTNFLFNIQQGIVEAKKPANEAELYDQLRKSFGDIHSVERRREKYESLKQTGSVQEFANKLKHHVLFLDPVPPAYEILRRFQSGLKPEIRAKMDEFHSDIKTLDAYINKADDIDRTQYKLKQAERKDERKDKEKESSKDKGRNYALGSSIPSPKNDPDGYKQWCRNNKACFNCASKKHLSRNCLRKDSNKESSTEKKESEND
jgi:Retrotransposon gag protein